MVDRKTRALAGIVAGLLVTVSCGGSDETDLTGGQAGSADGSAGSAGAGRGGSSGAAGALGSSGTGGGVGSSGAAGSSGALGSAGNGTTGSAGSAPGGSSGSAAGGSTAGGSGGSAAGGSAGSAAGGSGGLGGSGGEAGDASAGSAGIDGGTEGSAGAGGGAGSTGGTGTAGTGGSAGTGNVGTGGTVSDGGAGTSGVGGSGTGGTAGNDAGTECVDPGDCDNGSFCDGVEQCLNGVCVAGAPVVCSDDGYTCTEERCSESSMGCVSVPQASHCDDAAFCNGAEACAPEAPGADSRGCVAGVAPTCSDGIQCTADSCSDTDRACVFTPVHEQCNDGLYCTGTETCDPTHPAAVNGCVAGTLVNCEDGIACTADACNDATDSCDHVPNHLACSDGLPCNGVELCDATPVTGGCKAGSPVSCDDDGIQCTLEACDQSSGSCGTTLDNTKCPAGQTCTIGGCTDGPTCPGGTDTECQDGNPCNGLEICVTGICRPGPPVDCDDSIACTMDECNPATGACSHTASHGICNDGDPCNGIESCDPTPGTGGCKGGVPLTCDDSIACTADTCLLGFGCAHTANDLACQDELICNGAERCDPTPGTGGCKAGPPPTCQGDGIACTEESCVEPYGCLSTPKDDQCPCGQTCNPSEGGCGNFCKISTCGGKLYQCGDCIDNDLDCKIDSADEHCTGVCDNTENHLDPNLPGAPGGPCKLDCFFDNGNGPGNDDCYWDHKCDPLAVAPNYPPEGSSCAYDPTARPKPSLTCEQALTTQSALCTSYCGPLVPNGCDCFGCCLIPGAPTAVWLGSKDGNNGVCTLSTLSDPLKCKPCTQVPACLNTCERCELCLGKPNLPVDCNEQTCPPGRQACGLSGQPPCPEGSYCVTGCCQPLPGG